MRCGVALAAVAGLLLSAAPAQAGTSRVSDPGADVTVTWRFSNQTNLELSLTVRDTRCNSKPALGVVQIFFIGGSIDEVEVWNHNGCGTSRSYSTGLYNTGGNVVYIRTCADGDSNGLTLTCGLYQDNPYT
jgi:hypothetical protein